MLENLILEPLSDDNIKAVYYMCENNNVRFVSHPFEAFKKASLNSDNFDPDLSIVVKNTDDKVIAFFMAIFRRGFVLKNRKVAVLKFFVVDKEWRLKGIGSKIFKILLEKIKERAKFKTKFEVLSAMPDYWFPGLDPRHTEAYFFLKKFGFRKGGERVNLCVDLTQLSDDEPLSIHKNFEIKRAELKDKEELVPLKFMPRAYRIGFWPLEVALSFNNDPISTFIARDTKSREIIGWASHSIQFPGSFGPTGVKKSVRGQGLGTILLDWCLWDLKQAGFKKAKILWVVGDTIYFYLKSRGAYICEFFWTMKKRI
ncbi:MAG: GNAT family N-acetyltransferase [Promethearchaeota archaeon]